MTFRRLFLGLPVLALITAVMASSEAPFRYVEGRHGRGELRHINGLPVLTLQGAPEEMAEEEAVLAAKSAGRMLGYPRALLTNYCAGIAWPWFLARGKELLPQFPADHRREFDALVRAGLDPDLVLAGNTMFDITKCIACSSIVIEANRSATSVPLFGRNLDFPTLGYLQEYSLVKVYHPDGKHAFAAIGFPGLIGCLSGMNDAGLAVAVLEAFAAGDGSPQLDLKGTPYALCIRRILEECTTVDEAASLLRSLRRTTRFNLAVCDRHGGAVFEVTPKSLAVRAPSDGTCLCTNHFHTAGVAPKWHSNIQETRDRYQILLDQTYGAGKLDVSDVTEILHAVNQDSHTLQSMVFEPAALRLHLAIGPCPATKQPYRTLELRDMFARQ